MFCRKNEIVMARHFPLHAGENEDMATGNIAATVAAMVGGDALPAITIAQGGGGLLCGQFAVAKSQEWELVGSRNMPFY